LYISWTIFINGNKLSFIQKIIVYLFYFSESDSPKFLSDSRTFDCIKGLFPPLEKWFSPSTFHIHVFFFHPKSKTHFCPDLSRLHNSRSTHLKLVFHKPKLQFTMWTFTSFWNHVNGSSSARDIDVSNVRNCQNLERKTDTEYCESILLMICERKSIYIEK